MIEILLALCILISPVWFYLVIKYQKMYLDQYNHEKQAINATIMEVFGKVLDAYMKIVLPPPSPLPKMRFAGACFDEPSPWNADPYVCPAFADVKPMRCPPCPKTELPKKDNNDNNVRVVFNDKDIFKGTNVINCGGLDTQNEIKIE